MKKISLLLLLFASLIATCVSRKAECFEYADAFMRATPGVDTVLKGKETTVRIGLIFGSCCGAKPELVQTDFGYKTSTFEGIGKYECGKFPIASSLEELFVDYKFTPTDTGYYFIKLLNRDGSATVDSVFVM